MPYLTASPNRLAQDTTAQGDIMDRRVSPFRKSWWPTIKMVGGGIVVTALCVPALIAGYSGMNPLLLIIGGAGSIAGPMMVLLAPFFGRGGYGPCPVCETEIEAMGGGAQNLLCGGCATYLDVDGDQLTTIAGERAQETPFFAVPTPWPDIRNVVSSTVAFSAQDYVANVISDAMMKNKGSHVMDARWPDGCCVCGAPAVRRETYTLNVRMAGNIRDSHADLIVPGVPYCALHEDGIDLHRVTVDSRSHDDQFAMRFKSLAYRDAFRALNPWRWEGMVDPAPTASASGEGAAAEQRVIVQCPRCDQQLRVPAGRKGTIKCRACGEPFTAAT